MEVRSIGTRAARGRASPLIFPWIVCLSLFSFRICRCVWRHACRTLKPAQDAHPPAQDQSRAQAYRQAPHRHPVPPAQAYRQTPPRHPVPREQAYRPAPHLHPVPPAQAYRPAPPRFRPQAHPCVTHRPRAQAFYCPPRRPPVWAILAFSRFRSFMTFESSLSVFVAFSIIPPSLRPRRSEPRSVSRLRDCT